MQENNNNSEGKEIEFDVLTEIGNIGAGNATTALSQLINARIDMRVPKVDLLGFSELAEIVGGAETLVAGILSVSYTHLDVYKRQVLRELYLINISLQTR